MVSVSDNWFLKVIFNKLFMLAPLEMVFVKFNLFYYFTKVTYQLLIVYLQNIININWYFMVREYSEKNVILSNT